MTEKFIYALGFFDGVHRGHQALMTACGKLAQQAECGTGAVTFSGHPDTLVLGRTPELITDPEDRIRLLNWFGIEKTVSLPFDRQLMNMPWQDFFRMLKEDYGAAGLVCGDDFRFGYRGEGTPEKLQQACREAGMLCAVVPGQSIDGVRISSTYIRQLLEQGKMEEAVQFLGHPHILTGTVVSGRKLGRTLGIPTANLLIPEGVIVPKFGVYACSVCLEGKNYPAVTNVGRRPTVGGHRITVEPWILDFDGDLYGKELTLQMFAFLRPEQKFASLEALQAEIRRNAVQTRNFFRNFGQPEKSGKITDKNSK